MRINNSKNVDVNIVQSHRCIHRSHQDSRDVGCTANINKAVMFTPNHHHVIRAVFDALLDLPLAVLRRSTSNGQGCKDTSQHVSRHCVLQAGESSPPYLS